jgi:hypothetical protein
MPEPGALVVACPPLASAWSVERLAARGADLRAPSLLIELPHGATEAEHFHALHSTLAGPLPADLEAFYWVNTDIGSPEVAQRLAQVLTTRRRALPPLAVMILRCHIPRTFVDTNRLLEEAPGQREMTAGIQDYVTNPRDRELLGTLHAGYAAAAEAAYAEVCGAGGVALTLHTFAPRSVSVDLGGDIVAGLRAAYRPGVYRRWPRRPDVEIISRLPSGEDLAPAGVPERLATHYGAIGIGVESNTTYPMHPATYGYRHVLRWPGQVLCLELNRGRLAAPFTPFLPSPISARKVTRMARPLAETLRGWLAERGLGD